MIQIIQRNCLYMGRKMIVYSTDLTIIIANVVKFLYYIIMVKKLHNQGHFHHSVKVSIFKPHFQSTKSL